MLQVLTAYRVEGAYKVVESQLDILEGMLKLYYSLIKTSLYGHFLLSFTTLMILWMSCEM